jgi:CRP/FNR family transcriptional regulator, cyclic AMP receptor protein
LPAVLSWRLRRDAVLLQEAVFGGVADRLAPALLRMAEQQADPVGTGANRAVHVTQEERAGALGVTRESVNKWLGYYERRGVLRHQRGQITPQRGQRFSPTGATPAHQAIPRLRSPPRARGKRQ